MTLTKIHVNQKPSIVSGQRHHDYNENSRVTTQDENKNSCKLKAK